MSKTHWKPYGPYEGSYLSFYDASQDARGYHFGQGLRGKIAPPTPRGLKSLAWWSPDRPKRLRIIRRMRDQDLNEILRLRRKGEGSTFSNPSHSSTEHQRSWNDGDQEPFKGESEEQRASRMHNLRVA